jgi:hypothetical protein
MAKVYPVSIKSIDSQDELFFTIVIANNFEDACDMARDEFMQTLTFEEYKHDFVKAADELQDC